MVVWYDCGGISGGYDCGGISMGEWLWGLVGGIWLGVSVAWSVITRGVGVVGHPTLVFVILLRVVWCGGDCRCLPFV